MLRPHPAQARRRGLVSQVQILGLAPEAWSGQSNHKAVFIGIVRKQEQLLQSYCSKRIPNPTQFVILQLLASVPGLPHFDLLFAFTIIHGIGRLMKLKRERPGSIHHVNDIRWTRGGRGPTAKTTHRTIRLSAYHVFGLQTLV